MKKLPKFTFLIFRMLMLTFGIFYSFYLGAIYEKNKRYLHPKWGTNVIHNKIKKKDLGPVFYSKKQCMIVINALGEIDGKTRNCIKIIE